MPFTMSKWLMIVARWDCFSLGFAPRLVVHVDLGGHNNSKILVIKLPEQMLQGEIVPSSVGRPLTQRFFFVSPIHSRMELELP